MNYPAHYIKIFLFSVFILSGAHGTIWAASLDFGWGRPIDLKQKTDVNKSYLAWPIQITNSTGKRVVPNLDVVAVTNTGKQYAPLSTVKVDAPSPHGDFLSISALHSNIFPSATRSTIAVFENMDPKAGVIHFYVGGLVLPEPSGDPPQAGSTTYLRITYKRSQTGWEWEGTSVLK
ncbi:MAG: hypothetical protein HY204_05635 [Nitrospirae bacterium]|nr:hypothetical protein [Nitrospirota bacterium]